jgi:hypothetical protein
MEGKIKSNSEIISAQTQDLEITKKENDIYEGQIRAHEDTI